MFNETRIFTQWGSLARPFAAYAREERQALLRGAAALIERINHEAGVTCFLSYGALLGAVRGGSLIGHDFDIDAVFMPGTGRKEDMAAAVETVAGFLQREGFTITTETNGQFRADKQVVGRPFSLDFFAAWIEGDRYFQYFAVPGAPIAHAVLPLGTIAIDDVAFPAPREPETLLAAIYGAGWRTPDPDFRYDLREEDWRPFSYLFTKQNQDFWQDYYSKLSENPVWVEFPSQFAVFAASLLRQGGSILEVGCGNGRDGLFLARCGFRMTLTDYSAAAIEACRRRAEGQPGQLEFELLDVRDIPATMRFVAMHGGQYDAVYARFFIHAIDLEAARRFLKLAFGVLKKGGLLLLEYRALNMTDPDSQNVQVFENGAHYRRMVPQAELEADAVKTGFARHYAVQGRGMANYRSEDPWIGRSVFVVP